MCPTTSGQEKGQGENDLVKSHTAALSHGPGHLPHVAQPWPGKQRPQEPARAPAARGSATAWEAAPTRACEGTCCRPSPRQTALTATLSGDGVKCGWHMARPDSLHWGSPSQEQTHLSRLVFTAYNLSWILVFLGNDA